MTTALTLQNPLIQKLVQATDPAETKQIEAVARAAQAWAEENQDYEKLVSAVELYVTARRRTTELVKPYIQHGGNRQGNQHTTLIDFGFTKQQWNRRTKELEIPEETLTAYFDECVQNGWHPSLAGLIRHAYKGSSSAGNTDITCPNCGAVIHR